MTAQVLLTETEAAEALRVCPRTLRKARQNKRLTYVLIGRAVRYTMSDLEAFVEASRQDTAPCQPMNVTRRAVRAKTGNIIPFSQRN